LHARPVGPAQYLELERTHAAWRIMQNHLAG
jgi:hypothetical protein